MDLTTLGTEDFASQSLPSDFSFSSGASAGYTNSGNSFTHIMNTPGATFGTFLTDSSKESPASSL